MITKLFGTDGIRGEANKWPITPEVAMRVGRAIARVLPAKPNSSHKVIIGKDTRLSGYMLEYALTTGLISEGAEVHLTGPIPTPAIAYLTKSMQCDAGIILTASHNPYEDNGIKIFGPDGYKLNDSLEEEIEKIILQEQLDEPNTKLELGKAYRLTGAKGRYIEFVKNAAGGTSLNGLKIVLDCANGASYEVGPDIFRELGAEVISLNTSPNGTNINENCGALHPDKTAKIVKQEKADIGICFDGDADRVIFIDENGEIVSGDKILAMCAISLKKQGRLAQNTLVATVMSNLGLQDALAKHGIEVATTAVGDRHVVECMRNGGYSLGGENSGHLIFAENATTGDGIMSALQILGMLKRENSSLSVLSSCMQEYPQELHAIEVTEKPPLETVLPLHQAMQEATRELGENGRILVRYSGTEKKIRILVEAKDSTIAVKYATLLCNTVNSTIGAIHEPC